MKEYTCNIPDLMFTNIVTKENCEIKDLISYHNDNSNIVVECAFLHTELSAVKAWINSDAVHMKCLWHTQDTNGMKSIYEEKYLAVDISNAYVKENYYYSAPIIGFEIKVKRIGELYA